MSEPRLLLIPSNGRWSLPHILSKEPHPGIVGYINEALKAQWAVDVTVLRCVYDAIDAENLTGQRVYALENHSPDWHPPFPARWVAINEFHSHPLSNHDHWPILNAWFDEAAAGNIPKGRVAWAQSGWFDSASEWIYRQLERHGIRATGPVEQLRAWQISSILRINSACGYLYFKAVSDTFAFAPQLMESLVGLFPGYLPSVLAVDDERGWILMRDFGGRTLDKVTDLVRWQEAVRRFGHIQASSARYADVWLKLGCPSQGLDWLCSQSDTLLLDTNSMSPARFPGMSEEKIQQLQSLGPSLKAACARLADFCLPDTLVNNDFHAGNIISDGTRMVYFDWADSAVTFPLFSLVSLVDAENFLQGLPYARAQVRDAYLEAWTDYAPMHRLVKAFDLALPVGALYHAANHHRVIEEIELHSRWELTVTVPYWLNRVWHHKDRLLDIR